MHGRPALEAWSGWHPAPDDGHALFMTACRLCRRRVALDRVGPASAVASRSASGRILMPLPSVDIIQSALSLSASLAGAGCCS